MSEHDNKTDYRFRIIDKFTYEYDTPTQWQAWNDAYMRRIAGVPRAGREWVRLHSSGCITPDSALPNCTRACGNAKTMFSSAENVWNCITLATVAMDTLDDSKGVELENFEKMDQILTIGGSLKEFGKLDIFESVRKCFWKSCSDPKYGKCTQGLQNFKCGEVSPRNLQGFGDMIDHEYCEHAKVAIDSDIAGPGMLIAYKIQAILVLVLATIFWFIYLRNSWRHHFRAIMTLCTGGDSISRRSEDDEPEPVETPDPETVDGFTGAVYRALSNLQEAQSAFCITIGVIFFIAFGRGELGLANVTNLLSYTINQDIAFGFLIVGTISVAVIHACLRQAGWNRKSWLLPVGLSWALLIVAHHYRIKNQWAKPETFLGNLKTHATVDDCGNNPGPMSFCLGSGNLGLDESQKFLVTTRSLIIAVHFTCGWLVVCDLISLLDSVISWLTDVSPIANWMRDHIHRHRGRQLALSLLALALNLLGFSILVIGLVDVFKAFNKARALNDDQHVWGFGQLAAIAVWLPAALKFAKAVWSVTFGPVVKKWLNHVNRWIRSLLVKVDVIKPARKEPEDDSEGTQSLLLLPKQTWGNI